ncbi:hypothetical protein PIN31115_04502 [Pandoraea iniqua]|uniref:Uncharacterized protein n=1 Tax=Pandoraea iniqua TaxID=2508288 RepID=A0A5E4YHY1_9BURK|nr:hypothetical protein [Pandoraea iniqua]VVE48082.1 hypothetical protein PIN31115_04502 [Pandoraea iniqua]
MSYYQIPPARSPANTTSTTSTRQAGEPTPLASPENMTFAGASLAPVMQPRAGAQTMGQQDTPAAEHHLGIDDIASIGVPTDAPRISAPTTQSLEFSSSDSVPEASSDSSSPVWGFDPDEQYGDMLEDADWNNDMHHEDLDTLELDALGLPALPAYEGKAGQAMAVFSRVLPIYLELAPYVLNSHHYDADHQSQMSRMNSCLAQMSESMQRALNAEASEPQGHERVAQYVRQLLIECVGNMRPDAFVAMLAVSKFKLTHIGPEGVTPRTLQIAKNNQPMAWHAVMAGQFSKLAVLAPEKFERVLEQMRQQTSDSLQNPSIGTQAPTPEPPKHERQWRACQTIEPFSRLAQQWPDLTWPLVDRHTLERLHRALSEDDPALGTLRENAVATLFGEFDWQEGHIERLVAEWESIQSNAERQREAQLSRLISMQQAPAAVEQNHATAAPFAQPSTPSIPHS